ncbi:hypothetical protein BH20ACT9_BH20ACT9_07280 [soil metagenome]
MVFQRPALFDGTVADVFLQVRSTVRPYVVGSQATGEALVVDPRRDVDVYLDAAAQAGLQVRYVLDSHQHNDYLSGVARTGRACGGDGAGQRRGRPGL